MFPDSEYRDALPFVFVNLPIYRGATVVLEDDIKKLAQFIRGNDPNGARRRFLNRWLDEKQSLGHFLAAHAAGS